MSGVFHVVLAVLLLFGDNCFASGRHKRIVGGDRASPPPAGASEAVDEVENPALASSPPTTTTTTTTKRPSTQRPVDDDDGGPIVFVRRGRREARVKGRKDSDGVCSFQGIRYAQPPVGKLRFQRPRQAKLQGDVNAKAPGPPCPQTIGQRLIGSEDCLFLNVYTPEIPKDSEAKKYPVLFWVHGGGYRRGSGSQYNPKDLVKKGLVVVTIQYRLGSLGFLCTNRKELPGNAGLFDISTSLRWVRHHIEAFGGDRNHIIPAGQGSGASAAQMLALNKYSKGWIKGVLAMSGTAISSFAVDKEPDETAKEVSAVDSCHTITDSLGFVRCMQKLPVDALIKGDDKVQEGRLADDNKAKSYLTSISKLLNPGPAVEGEDDERFLPNFLTATPQDILKKGDFAKVPLLTGVTKDETSTSAKGGGIASQLLGQVGDAAEEILESVVSELLQINTGFIGGNALNPLLNNLVNNNVLQLSKGITSSLKVMGNTLDKIVEVTTDALFNLPAFLTSQEWSKQGKAYLYSFEHNSSTTTADDFLKDSPLTEQKQDTKVEGVGHGDDLIYLFDVMPIEGDSSEGKNLTDPEDIKVRDTFTDMVAEFARSGEPKLNGRSVSPFSANNGDYMIISSSPSVAKGFRKCQMGLWAGLAEVLKSAECNSLQLGDVVKSLGVGGLTGQLTNTTGGLGLIGGSRGAGGLGGLVGGNKGGLGGLLGANQAQTPKPSGGLLGKLG